MLGAGEAGTAVADHGGSLGQARALFIGAPEPWIDLSTGINPNSYPLFDLPATALTRLPEQDRLAGLQRIAAAAYGAPSGKNVVAAPGTQILLPLVMGLAPPGRAKILGPTYAEHLRAAALCGHAASEVRDFDRLAEADVAVVVNPNNPDGRLVAGAELRDLSERFSRSGGLLVVDEAFMDATDAAESVSPHVGVPGLVVLRSFGKFFGLAGTRLGFALVHEATAERLRAMLGPWAVSGPALEYGVRGLEDRAWQEATRAALALAASKLDGLLSGAGLTVVGGTPLYRFVETPQAGALFAFLGERGIFVRRFSWSATGLRLGLPGAKMEWERLAAALDRWRDGCR